MSKCLESGAGFTRQVAESSEPIFRAGMCVRKPVVAAAHILQSQQSLTSMQHEECIKREVDEQSPSGKTLFLWGNLRYSEIVEVSQVISGYLRASQVVLCRSEILQNSQSISG